MLSFMHMWGSPTSTWRIHAPQAAFLLEHEPHRSVLGRTMLAPERRRFLTPGFLHGAGAAWVRWGGGGRGPRVRQSWRVSRRLLGRFAPRWPPVFATAPGLARAVRRGPARRGSSPGATKARSSSRGRYARCRGPRPGGQWPQARGDGRPEAEGARGSRPPRSVVPSHVRGQEPPRPGVSPATAGRARLRWPV
jgi:hypothetical protein